LTIKTLDNKVLQTQMFIKTLKTLSTKITIVKHVFNKVVD